MINIGQAHLDFGDHNEGMCKMREGLAILEEIAAGDQTLEELLATATKGLERAKKLESKSRGLALIL
eukprot:1701718-Rhodomonas_salina.2